MSIAPFTIRRALVRGVLLGASASLAPCAAIAQMPTTLDATSELSPPDPASTVFDGWSVAVDGDTLAVGAWSGAGQCFVYTRVGGAWTLQAELVPANPTYAFGFGRSVGVEGDVLVVGAQDEDLGGGAFYVFERTGTTWDAGRRITIPGSAGVGSAVAIGNGRLVIGAEADNGSRGAVFVLERADSDWAIAQKLVAPDPVSRLGSSVAVRGSRIVSGAPTTTSSSGRAFVFEHDGTQWLPAATLVPADPADNAYFGDSVAIDGDVIAIGAPAYSAPLLGACYVFARGTSEWLQETRLAGESVGDRFGSAVVLRDGRLVVGAQLLGHGAARVFERNAGRWPWKFELAASPLTSFAHFGLAVALAGNDVVVGAPYDGYDVPGGNPAVGSAWTFDVPRPVTFSTCVADPDGAGRVCRIGANGSASLATNDFSLVATGCPPLAPGLFLCGPAQASIPMASGHLCVSPIHPGIFRLGPNVRADASGIATRVLDFQALPPGCAMSPGETWYFQLWHRDSGPGGYDLSDGLGVTWTP